MTVNKTGKPPVEVGKSVHGWTVTHSTLNQPCCNTKVKSITKDMAV